MIARIKNFIGKCEELHIPTTRIDGFFGRGYERDGWMAPCSDCRHSEESDLRPVVQIETNRARAAKLLQPHELIRREARLAFPFRKSARLATPQSRKNARQHSA